MPGYTKLLKMLIAAVLANASKEHVVAQVLDLFDTHFEPIDLPGPDEWIDPILRKRLQATAERLYDELADFVAAAPVNRERLVAYLAKLEE